MFSVLDYTNYINFSFHIKRLFFSLAFVKPEKSVLIRLHIGVTEI